MPSAFDLEMIATTQELLAEFGADASLVGGAYTYDPSSGTGSTASVSATMRITPPSDEDVKMPGSDIVAYRELTCYVDAASITPSSVVPAATMRVVFGGTEFVVKAVRRMYVGSTVVLYRLAL